jgi:galactitol-specific phosphotransferase system IIC component
MAYLYLIAIIFILFLMMQNKTRGMNVAIEKLIRQSARYAVAAQQDASPVIAILHANYAAAYFYALKDIASESQIHNATGIDVKKFKEHVTNVQDMVTRRTSEKCPEFVGEVDIYLAQIGGEAA